MPKKNGKNTPRRKILTLRIDPATAKKLHAISLARSKKTGRSASYNECMINLINEA